MKSEPHSAAAIGAAQIEQAVTSAGLHPISPVAAADFATYLQLLLKWNARLNLTAIREPAELVRRQFLECIQCAQALPEAATLLDFGSGAGFPGIPIAILRPEIRVVLGESQSRKASFLQEAVRNLGLSATVYDGRIEQMAEGIKFDIVTLRAVDNLPEACSLAAERLNHNGTMAVFATITTDPGIRSATPSIAWQSPVPTVGLSNGHLMMGQPKRK